MMNRFHWALVLILPLSLMSCSSTPDSAETSSQDISSLDEQIFVGDSIEMSYDPNVIMKRAESFFDKESYAEAVVEYKHFLDLHRNHILAPYAQYKIGVSHFNQFRTVDRDPLPLKKAITGFEKLLKEFPASRYETEAKETILTCKEHLVQRHLMVGEFYFKRGSYLAAAHRYEKIINEYPELKTTSEAMFHLAKTYQDLGIEEWTQDWLVALIRQYPESSYHASAQSLLASLQEEHPTLLASLPDSPFPTEKSVIPVSVNSATPHTSDNPVSTNTSLLPNTAPEARPVIFTKEPTPATCAIGTWCDAQAAQPTQSIAQTTSTQPATNPTSTKTCTAGEWC
jgi:outer membrane protein assembly factor BamD